MRCRIYCIFSILAAILIVDTNLGWPISAYDSGILLKTADYLQERHFTSEADTIRKIVRSNGFRESPIYSSIFKLRVHGDHSYSYYAYTPSLSRKRIFLGDNFWQAGKVGRGSILLHELQHLRRHDRRFLRGIPYAADEAEAYCTQYATHKAVGLEADGKDSVVYWDMMIGIQEYVVEGDEANPKSHEIRNALRTLAGMTYPGK